VQGTLVFENAKLVLPDAMVAGWLAAEGERILEFGEGRAPERGIDLAGDLLVPGLIELHTDHLETHLTPRPKVKWPTLAALLAYDAQITASGITTVFDSLRVGDDADRGSSIGELSAIVDALEAAGRQQLLRADHRLHLRCEICAGNVLQQTAEILARRKVGLISLMDHTPGTRQFVDLEAWKTYYGGKSGLADHELERFMNMKRLAHARNYRDHRAGLVALARAHAVVTASHDDSTPEHVRESIADGADIAEFPTTLRAAATSHQAGIAVLMGAPNVVRGGSHSGNVAAETLAREGVLDILSSDYVPASLLMGAFELARRVDGLGLPAALKRVTLTPAEAARLYDRGRIAAGLRADLVRVREAEDLPVVLEVYRGGRRAV
jgi:alpha-D-ribose 1-methylphosphonate 5-triphosphate diphosphatase